MRQFLKQIALPSQAITGFYSHGFKIKIIETKSGLISNYMYGDHFLYHMCCFYSHCVSINQVYSLFKKIIVTYGNKSHC